MVNDFGWIAAGLLILAFFQALTAVGLFILADDVWRQRRLIRDALAGKLGR